MQINTSFCIRNMWIWVFSLLPPLLFMLVIQKSKHQTLCLSGRARSMETAGGKGQRHDSEEFVVCCCHLKY